MTLACHSIRHVTNARVEKAGRTPPPPPPILLQVNKSTGWAPVMKERGGGLTMPTEAEGARELVQHGVLPSLPRRVWPGRCDLYCDGRSVPPVLTDCTACPGSMAAQLRLVEVKHYIKHM
jgi:hypothetical protein